MGIHFTSLFSQWSPLTSGSAFNAGPFCVAPITTLEGEGPVVGLDIGGGSLPAQQAHRLQAIVVGRSLVTSERNRGPEHALAAHIENTIARAIESKKSSQELEREFRAGLPRNVAMILMEKVGKNLEYEPRWIKSLAQELQIKSPWGERIILRWQVYTHPNQRQLLSVEEWFSDRGRLQTLLRQKFVNLRKGGETLDVSFMVDALKLSPVIIHETFLNSTLRAGKDVPRASRQEFLRTIGKVSRGTRDAVVDWERFWEREASKYEWRVKPEATSAHHNERSNNGPFNGVFSGINYAKMCGWTLLDFAHWLESELKNDFARRYVLQAFWAVVDRKVLSKPDEKPVPRPQFCELKKQIGCDVVEHTLVRWMNRWEDFAIGMGGENAIRPRKERAVVTRQNLEKGDVRLAIFVAAAQAGDPKAVQQGFLDRGLTEEARVLANLLTGIDEEPKIPVSRLGSSAADKKRLLQMERRFVSLAAAHGFECKKASDLSNQNSRKIGRQLQRLLAKAKAEKLNLKSFGETFKEDEALRALLGDRSSVISDLFNFWLKKSRQKGAAEPSRRSPWRARFNARGISNTALDGWMDRFEEWEKELQFHKK